MDKKPSLIIDYNTASLLAAVLLGVKPQVRKPAGLPVIADAE
jgi:hypothetical protein